MGLTSAGSANECRANLAGNVAQAPNIYESDWIVDSRGTHHVTSCKGLLTDLKCISDKRSSTVQLPTGNRAQITCTGSSIIMDMHRKLLSVSKLTRDLLCCVSFFPNFCVLQDLYRGKVIGIGRESEGVYLLKDSIKAVVGAAIRNDNSTTLWHLRLGHPSFTAMKHISSISAKLSHNHAVTYILSPNKVGQFFMIVCISLVLYFS